MSRSAENVENFKEWKIISTYSRYLLGTMVSHIISLMFGIVSLWDKEGWGCTGFFGVFFVPSISKFNTIN